MTEFLAECARYEADLSALLDGELAPARDAEVRAHVNGCGRCQAQLEVFGSIDLSLAGTALPTVPGELRARIQCEIDREVEPVALVNVRSARRSRSWRSPVVGSALAVAASLMVYVALRNPAPDPVESSGFPEIELTDVTDNELAVVMEYDTILDLEVIANLELLEQLAAVRGGPS